MVANLSPLLQSGFPLGLENLEMGEPFPVKEKSGNFDQTHETGRVRKFYPKYWKSMKHG